jgi:hypothetical protein
LKRKIPFELPAGTSEDLECDLQTVQAGPFESQIHLHVDDFGLRELIMTVHGEAKAK